MNIAVITPFDSSNFGAYLQAYCLKKILEDLGHDVVHFPTRDSDYVKALYYTEKAIGKRDKLMPWKFQLKKEFGRRKWEMFREEQQEFQVVNPEEVNPDLYILGSDEIWNIQKEVFRRGIFWGRDFSPVISYATSIGGARLEDYERYPELIGDLHHISTALVRDERTLALVQGNSPIESHLVCDPTMLVPVSEYGKELNDSYIEQNDCMLIYTYSLTIAQRNEIRKCAKQLGLKTVSCCFYHDWCDYQCECSPLQFSSLIRKSKAVVTTTFHGTVFSILNHANFISIPTSPKTIQILDQIGLRRRSLALDNLNAESMVGILSDLQIDYGRIEQVLSDMRCNSVEKLKKAIAKATADLQNKFSYQICPYDDCTGCFACMNKCPKQAIFCTVDIYGRSVPQIDPTKCVKCGLCQETCKRLKTVDKHTLRQCYATQRVEAKERVKSASGGVGAVLAEYILKDQGTVYGATVVNGALVLHTSASDLKEGDKFRFSKYVQSHINYSYQDVFEQLKVGKKVLFTGTPCQIAGLKAYLGEDYENLYCVDLICHGVPPMQYLQQHISSIPGIEKEKITGMSFRGGKEVDFTLTLKQDDKIVYSQDVYNDTYFTAFLNGLTYRENCFKCPYTSVERVGDLTIGDFWGLNRDSLKTNQEGKISVLLVNTEKGKKLFEQIKEELVYEERDIEEAIQGNPQLQRPTIRHKKREYFLKAYCISNDFEEALKVAGIYREMAIINFKRTNRVWGVLRKIKRSIIKEKRA